MQVIMAVAVQHCNIVGAGPCEIMHSTNSRNRNSQGTFGFEMAKFDSAAEVTLALHIRTVIRLVCVCMCHQQDQVLTKDREIYSDCLFSMV